MGKNGCGKTSILEAISLLTYGKGIKQDSLDKIINYNSNICHIKGIVNSRLGNISINSSIYLDNKNNKYIKKYTVDEKNLSNIEDLNNYLNSVWFTPYMDNFFMQDGSLRRKFIDKLIFILYKNHATLINKQDKLLRERINLLINHKHNSWLNIVEEELVNVSVAIVAQRLMFIKQLNSILQQKKRYPVTLSFNGEIEDLFIQNHAALKVEQELIKQIYNRRSQDSITKQNSYSANKSKLKGYSLNHNIECNQHSVGEQKVMVINIINAFIELVIQNKKYTPIILLDEINVHLDKENLDYTIQDMLKYKVQLFITATDKSYYNNFLNCFNILQLA